MNISRLVLLPLIAFASACATPAASPEPGARVASSLYSPARDLGQLFHDVQTAGVFDDSKTFVDARPLHQPPDIVAAYQRERSGPGFDLRRFVERNFEMPGAAGAGVRTDRSHSMEEHIRALWPALTRPADAPDPRSSLIPLPNEYVVPGGRFREVYYWDSYFTMLGLVESRRTDLIKGMLDNFAFLVRTIGHVPNGNRTYYLGRSQPPYFAAMVGLYASATDTSRALEYLDELEKEHAFWMDGASTLPPGGSHRRVVRMNSGAILNRYWDDIPEPRPESYREDEALGRTLEGEARTLLYRNLRAGAESGWDYSSRWMRNPSDLRSLEVIDIVPIDLNSLLYHSERTIAALRRFRGQAGDLDAAARFERAAADRRAALLAAAWDPTDGFFYDVRWKSGERVTDRPTLAAAAPLYFGLATPEQGRAVADRLERDFLKSGGFVTTLIKSGQQWDAPNGWPPLQWLAVEGARRYGRGSLATTARTRWLALNRRVYNATGKMTEKYDVVDPDRPAGGGEYPTQDGFGWSNGVALRFSAMEAGPRQAVPDDAAAAARTSTTVGAP
jgi:alpha,alpha-trehalase